LFRRNPEDFWRNNKECPPDYWNEQKLLQALDSCQLVPVADPNVPSHIHRVAKALGLVQLSAMPQFAQLLDPKEVLMRVLAAMREDSVGLVVTPQPGQQEPPAKDKAALMTANANMMKANAQVGKIQADANATDAKGQLQAQDLQTQKDLKTADITKELIIHEADQQKIQADQQKDAVAQEANQNAANREAALDQQKHGLELVKAGLGAHQDQKEHGLATVQADREHGLGLAAHAVEAQSAAVDDAVKVHQALNPPKPAAPAAKPKPKGKK
jgi:hypothetical protein